MKFYAVAGLLAVLALHALAENNEVNSQSSGATPKTQAVANTKSPSDGYTGLINSYGTAIATGGAVVVGVVVLLAIAAIVSPLFGYKLCQIFSTCEGSPTSMAYSLDANQGGFPPSYGNNAYKKRSIENTVGPILNVLSSAYEKYGHAVNPALTAIAQKNLHE